ncbi:YidC/Oxa1 family membrane protein insertase [Melissococcus plutonius]|uniref:Membrane protein insertase YidC n=1 Tax=Melissococcus plutonius (strain ATCC 35311 / DSM 29964 / CIP 104052 / LMG 20360 / NCIMB 702443) TaxID=940190 RepID=F3YCL1_MELPT|nr:YidC/Oxa1 family membrane protein insertase [Melissococcus plutonius]AIM25420.1 membrane protein insertase YidC [Melissococcus plutonius S1]KMT23741.1 membrane protein insertase YidC [Melissococcus plutonius]KMT24325.1 membrane protein insertase YidC [Melissococcus plutonius]KMT27009.1 membrane protein insertase YidC [Melissococcus plutonius]KMT30512.1 membrane protein insertase YidC [Melissococcus plutonius]
MKKRKHLLLIISLAAVLFVLSACGTSPITKDSTGIWDRYIVFYFAKAIQFLSLNRNIGIGIVFFTIVIRVILLPLMYFQTKSMRKMQDIQPQLKKLQQKYSSKDPETQRLFRDEQQRLYTENNVNPYAGCLPLLVQMPILMALYQAISRIPELKQGNFMWLALNKPDPYLILPILAAVFTFASTYLSNMSQLESNISLKIMNFFMPVMIFLMGIQLASGLSLYWTVSNAFQAGQTLVLNNPFKIRREREEEAKKLREKEKALKKAKNPKKKIRKK